ncbi:MAG: cache domain-containing protein [Rubrivivax sp.]
MTDDRDGERDGASALSLRQPASAPPLKPLLRLLWLAMLPLLLLAAALALENARQQHSDQDRRAATAAARLAAAADELVRDRVRALQFLSGSVLLDEGRLADFHRRAQSYRQQFGSDLIYAGADGRLLLHSGMPWGDPLPPWPLPSGIGAVPQALAGGRPAMSGIFISPLARQPQLAVAVPMLRAGRARGVLVATMPTSLLDDALAHAGIPAGWHAALLDEAGQPIAGHLPHPANNGSRAPLRYMQAATQAPWTAVVEPQPTSTGFALAAAAAALVAALAGVALAGRMARRVLWPAAPRAGRRSPRAPLAPQRRMVATRYLRAAAPGENRKHRRHLKDLKHLKHRKGRAPMPR